VSKLDWFRVYYEARTDKKLDTLTDAEHRVWFDLMCYAVEQSGRQMRLHGEDTEPGVLSVEVSRGDEDLLNTTMAKLVRLKIIAIGDDFIAFIHGEERQYDKPSDMPDAVRERVAKSRAGASVSRDVTPCIAKPPLEESRGEKRREGQDTGHTCAPEGDIAQVGTAFERYTGKTAPLGLVALCADHPTSHLIEAIRLASENGKSAIPYIRGIAQRLVADGWKPEPSIVSEPGQYDWASSL
jgi:hypothetical protein